MTQRNIRNISIESTYKARDVEEQIDIWFYRPIGFRIAKFAASVGIVPNTITIVGIILGITAGHLLYYLGTPLPYIGMILWSVSNMFDSADGQLARMTGQTSEFGRILDGFGGNLVFFSMYFHLCLYHALHNGFLGWWVFPIALSAGACHAMQSAMADYFRNGYLRYGVGGKKGEIGESQHVRPGYDALSWKRNFVRKFLTRIYLNYTMQQESLSPAYQEFRMLVAERYGDEVPVWIRDEFRRLNKPLLKYHNYMTINGRVLTMFFFIAIGHPVFFFFTELTLVNILFFFVLRRQERNSRRLIDMIRGRTTPEAEEVGDQRLEVA